VIIEFVFDFLSMTLFWRELVYAIWFSRISGYQIINFPSLSTCKSYSRIKIDFRFCSKGFEFDFLHEMGSKEPSLLTRIKSACPESSFL